MTFGERMDERTTVTEPMKASVSVKTDGDNNQGRGEGSVLSERMMRFVRHHYVGLDASTLQDYTFKRDKTEYPNGKAGLEIFDGSGRLIFQGSEFRSGMAGYWRPSRISTAPRWASNEESWGRPPTDQLLPA